MNTELWFPLLLWLFFPYSKYIHFLLSIWPSYYSCDAIRWFPVSKRKLPCTSVRASEDNCRLWRGLQQWRGKISECLGTTFRWWWYQWQESQAKKLMSDSCIVNAGDNVEKNAKENRYVLYCQNLLCFHG